MPGELAKLFEFYVGSWSLEGTLGDAPLKGRAFVRVPPGGHCILGTVSLRVEGERMQQFSFVSGWDSSTGWATEQGAGSDGAIYRLEWRKVSSTVDEGELVGTVGGKKVTEKDRLERKGNNEFTVVATERTEGDKSLPDLKFVFQRVVREKAKLRGRR